MQKQVDLSYSKVLLKRLLKEREISSNMVENGLTLKEIKSLFFSAQANRTNGNGSKEDALEEQKQMQFVTKICNFASGVTTRQVFRKTCVK